MSAQKKWLRDVSRRPSEVSMTEAQVTRQVPKRRMRRWDRSDEMTVPRLTTRLTRPATESGAPSSVCISGQATPRTESGRPSEMNAA